jgi:hypothetical protein
VGPGARWVQVVEALEPYGLTVVGGRLGKSPLLPLNRKSRKAENSCVI